MDHNNAPADVKNKKSQWLEIIEAFHSSGQNQTLFCKQRGINRDNFSYHLRRSYKSKRLSSKLSFLPVEIPQEKWILKIADSVSLEIPNTMNMEQLSNLILYLRRGLC